MAWELGMYFKTALQTSAVAVKSVLVKNHNNLPKYPEMPFKEENGISQGILQKKREQAFHGFVSLLTNCKKKGR